MRKLITTTTILTLLMSLALFAQSTTGNIGPIDPGDPPFDPPPLPFTPPPPCAGANCTGSFATPWGYCHYETGQDTHTFYLWLEIGIAAQQNQSGFDAVCNLPLPTPPCLITEISGNINYFTQVLGQERASMVVRVDTGTNNHLVTAKLAAWGPNSITSPVAQTFTVPIPTSGFAVFFNDDLAKPNVISVALSGTCQ